MKSRYHQAAVFSYSAVIHVLPFLLLWRTGGYNGREVGYPLDNPQIITGHNRNNSLTFIRKIDGRREEARQRENPREEWRTCHIPLEGNGVEQFGVNNIGR